MTTLGQTSSTWLILALLPLMTIGCQLGFGAQAAPTPMAPATPLPPISPVPPATPVPHPTPAPAVNAFPLHSEPLATDWGLWHKMGELVLESGCLRILEDPNLSDHDYFVPSFLPVWPEGFSRTGTGDTVAVIDRSGQVVAQVGDYVRLSGDGVYSESHRGEQIAKTLSPDCIALFYYLVGDDVTVIESDEPEVVQVADSDIFIRRQKTNERGFTPLPDTADGYGYASEPLVLENDCVVIPYRDGERYVPIWPAGFTGHIEDGVLEVRNGGGRKIVRIGERIRIRGSIVEEHLGGVYVSECEARLLRVKQVINADLPLAFLKHDNRWKQEEENTKNSLRGTVDVRNGCMHINNHYLLWPSDYRVEEDGDFFRVLDGSGMVAAQYDEVTTLKGHRIGSNDKLGPEIIRMMPTDCPPRTYWIVTGYE